MRKHYAVLVAAIAAMIVVAQAGPAAAASGQKPCPKLGYCAPGSCAQDGSTRACNPKNCSPHNCR